jgi:hypothetical protein
MSADVQDIARSLVELLRLGETCDQYRDLRSRCTALWDEHNETADPLVARRADQLADELGDIARGIADALIDAANWDDQPRRDPTPRLTDTQAVDWIARMLRAPEWNSAADYLEAITETIGSTGRDLEHPADCTGCGAWPAEGCSAPDEGAR